MTILVLLALGVLLLSGGRRSLIRHARFAVPAAFALVAGIAFGEFLVSKVNVTFPMSAVIPLIMGIALAVSLGMRVKIWCDQTFGPKDEPRHDNRRP